VYGNRAKAKAAHVQQAEYEQHQAALNKEKEKFAKLFIYNAFIATGLHQRVTPSERIMSYSCLVMAGNGQGVAGFGRGKASDPATAFERAKADIRRHLLYVPLVNGGGILHDVAARHNNTHVKIFSRPNNGILIGSTLGYAIMEAFGIKSATCVVEGRKVPYNVVYAIMAALSKLRSVKEVALARGRRPWWGTEPGMYNRPVIPTEAELSAQSAQVQQIMDSLDVPSWDVRSERKLQDVRDQIDRERVKDKRRLKLIAQGQKQQELEEQQRQNEEKRMNRPIDLDDVPQDEDDLVHTYFTGDDAIPALRDAKLGRRPSEYKHDDNDEYLEAPEPLDQTDIYGEPLPAQEDAWEKPSKIPLPNITQLISAAQETSQAKRDEIMAQVKSEWVGKIEAYQRGVDEDRVKNWNVFPMDFDFSPFSRHTRYAVQALINSDSPSSSSAPSTTTPTPTTGTDNYGAQMRALADPDMINVGLLRDEARDFEKVEAEITSSESTPSSRLQVLQDFEKRRVARELAAWGPQPEPVADLAVAKKRTLGWVMTRTPYESIAQERHRRQSKWFTKHGLEYWSPETTPALLREKSETLLANPKTSEATKDTLRWLWARQNKSGLKPYWPEDQTVKRLTSLATELRGYMPVELLFPEGIASQLVEANVANKVAGGIEAARRVRIARDEIINGIKLQLVPPLLAARQRETVRAEQHYAAYLDNERSQSKLNNPLLELFDRSHRQMQSEWHYEYYDKAEVPGREEWQQFKLAMEKEGKLLPAMDESPIVTTEPASSSSSPSSSSGTTASRSDDTEINIEDLNRSRWEQRRIGDGLAADEVKYASEADQADLALYKASGYDIARHIRTFLATYQPNESAPPPGLTSAEANQLHALIKSKFANFAQPAKSIVSLNNSSDADIKTLRVLIAKLLTPSQKAMDVANRRRPWTKLERARRKRAWDNRSIGDALHVRHVDHNDPEASLYLLGSDEIMGAIESFIKRYEAKEATSADDASLYKLLKEKLIIDNQETKAAGVLGKTSQGAMIIDEEAALTARHEVVTSNMSKLGDTNDADIKRLRVLLVAHLHKSGLGIVSEEVKADIAAGLAAPIPYNPASRNVTSTKWQPPRDNVNDDEEVDKVLELSSNKKNKNVSKDGDKSSSDDVKKVDGKANDIDDDEIPSLDGYVGDEDVQAPRGDDTPPEESFDEYDIDDVIDYERLEKEEFKAEVEKLMAAATTREEIRQLWALWKRGPQLTPRPHIPDSRDPSRRDPVDNWIISLGLDGISHPLVYYDQEQQSRMEWLSTIPPTQVDSLWKLAEDNGEKEHLIRMAARRWWLRVAQPKEQVEEYNDECDETGTGTLEEAASILRDWYALTRPKDTLGKDMKATMSDLANVDIQLSLIRERQLQRWRDMMLKSGKTQAQVDAIEAAANDRSKAAIEYDNNPFLSQEQARLAQRHEISVAAARQWEMKQLQREEEERRMKLATSPDDISDPTKPAFRGYGYVVGSDVKAKLANEWDDALTRGRVHQRCVAEVVAATQALNDAFSIVPTTSSSVVPNIPLLQRKLADAKNDLAIARLDVSKQPRGWLAARVAIEEMEQREEARMMQEIEDGIRHEDDTDPILRNTINPTTKAWSLTYLQRFEPETDSGAASDDSAGKDEQEIKEIMRARDELLEREIQSMSWPLDEATGVNRPAPTQELPELDDESLEKMSLTEDPAKDISTSDTKGKKDVSDDEGKVPSDEEEGSDNDNNRVMADGVKADYEDIVPRTTGGLPIIPNRPPPPLPTDAAYGDADANMTLDPFSFPEQRLYEQMTDIEAEITQPQLTLREAVARQLAGIRERMIVRDISTFPLALDRYDEAALNEINGLREFQMEWAHATDGESHAAKIEVAKKFVDWNPQLEAVSRQAFDMTKPYQSNDDEKSLTPVSSYRRSDGWEWPIDKDGQPISGARWNELIDELRTSHVKWLDRRGRVVKEGLNPLRAALQVEEQRMTRERIKRMARYQRMVLSESIPIDTLQREYPVANALPRYLRAAVPQPVVRTTSHSSRLDYYRHNRPPFAFPDNNRRHGDPFAPPSEWRMNR
jgi:small subunit ribosomal protein S5